MNAAKCAAEFLHHVAERRFERRAASDQDVIVPGAKRRGRREPDELAQAAPHPVAFDGIADLLRHREADPDSARRLSRFFTAQRLQHERLRRRACAGLGDGPKFRPAFQALHEMSFGFGLGRFGNEGPRTLRCSLDLDPIRLDRIKV